MVFSVDGSVTPTRAITETVTNILEMMTAVDPYREDKPAFRFVLINRQSVFVVTYIWKPVIRADSVCERTRVTFVGVCSSRVATVEVCRRGVDCIALECHPVCAIKVLLIVSVHARYVKCVITHALC